MRGTLGLWGGVHVNPDWGRGLGTGPQFQKRLPDSMFINRLGQGGREGQR